MEVKVIFLTVCLFALLITATEGAIPKCCISTKRHIRKEILQRVERWEMQQSNGVCDIKALRLYLREMTKPICAHPKIGRALMRIQRRKRNSRS